MRAVLFAVCIFIAYSALRAVLRRLLQTPSKPAGSSAASGEFVRDPECGVYVLKERAATRRIRGGVLYFCGEDCAAVHAARSRD